MPFASVRLLAYYFDSMAHGMVAFGPSWVSCWFSILGMADALVLQHHWPVVISEGFPNLFSFSRQSKVRYLMLLLAGFMNPFPPGTSESLNPISNHWYQSQTKPSSCTSWRWTHEWMNDFNPVRSLEVTLYSADATQQARDGARGWRLGDLWELPTQTRPLPHASVLTGGGKDVPRQQQQQQQAPRHQRAESRQLPGGGCTLPGQEVSSETQKGPSRGEGERKTWHICVHTTTAPVFPFFYKEMWFNGLKGKKRLFDFSAC